MKGVKGIMLEYFLREGETPEEFENRVCIDKLKGKIRTWDDVADIINNGTNHYSKIGIEIGEKDFFTYRDDFIFYINGI